MDPQMKIDFSNWTNNSHSCPDITTSVLTHGEVDQWKTEALACRIIIAICLAATIWILLSMVIYGTKTRRWWNTPGTSSLSNGEIFTTCVVAVATFVPRISMNLVLATIQVPVTSSVTCSTAGDLVGVTFFIAECAVYLYLWLLQRHIYTHPSVKNRVNIHVHRFSKVFVVAIIGVFVGTGYLFVYKVQSCEHPFFGCQINENNSRTVKNVTIAISCMVIAIQTTMLLLFVYPAVRARFEAPHDTGELGEEVQTPKPSKLQVIARWIPCSCGKDIYIGSPIEMTVKRAVFSAIFIVFTDVLGPVLDMAAMPKWAPKMYPVPSHDLSALVNVLCMLYTLGFTGPVLLLFIPNCPEWINRIKRPEYKVSRTEIENEMMTNSK